MKNKYVAFLTLAAGIAGSSITYTYAIHHKNPSLETVITKDIKNTELKNQLQAKEKVPYTYTDYSKEDINWLVSLIRFTRDEIKKSQNNDLSLTQSYEVILFSVDILNKLKENNQPLSYKIIPKSTVQFTDNEISWLLKDVKNKTIEFCSTYDECSSNWASINILATFFDDFEILEEKRRREQKDIVVYHKTAMPNVVQLDINTPERQKEWDLTRLYINDIMVKLTGYSIYSDSSKKDKETLKFEQEITSIIEEALPRMRMK